MADGTLLTSEQAADLLGVSNATVLRANRVGSLGSTGTSADGDPLFSREAVELYRRRRTELFRGAVRSGAPATPAKATPKPVETPAKPPAEAAAPKAEVEPVAEPVVEPEVTAEPATSAAEPESVPEPAAEESREEAQSEPMPEPERIPDTEVASAPPVPEAQPEPVRHPAPAQRTARRHQEPALPSLPEISREEWLDDWTTTVDWLDRLALSLSPIEVAQPAPAPRIYETPVYESVPEPEPPAAPVEQPASSESVSLAVRPVVSFAILKEIGVALRGRPGVVEARLDRLDGGAAWFVLRHDGSTSVEESVTSALRPLGFSISRSGQDGFEVVQDAAHTG